MKIKNIRTSLLILSGLVILSFGFFVYAQENSAYTNIFDNTSQPSSSDPSDLSSPLSTTGTSATSDANTTSDSNNMTQQVAQQILNLANSASGDSSSSDGSGEITMDQIQNLVNDSMANSKASSINLPQISSNDLKIKKQNYTGTAAEIQQKKQADFDNYIVAISYIIASNSPAPITSTMSLTDFATNIFNEVALAITTRSEAPLENLSASGQKILAQMKDVEVPEDLVNLHIEGMELAEYAIQIKDYVNVNSSDPLADIVNLSKLEGLASAAANFYSEVNDKFSQYNTDDTVIQNKLNSLGVSIPNISAISTLEQTTPQTSNSTATSNISTTSNSNDTLTQ